MVQTALIGFTILVALLPTTSSTTNSCLGDACGASGTMLLKLGSSTRKVSWVDSDTIGDNGSDSAVFDHSIPTKLMQTCQPRPKALFCFSLVRTPPEPTAVLLARQLDVTCDGWKLFGDTDDPAHNVTKAWEKRDFADAWVHQMQQVFVGGVWKYLVNSGALDRYEWFVNVEADSFIRPSTFRHTFEMLHKDCKPDAYFITDNQIDGYFIAWNADMVSGVQSQGWPKVCDVVMSGHNGDLEDPTDNAEECLKRFNIRTPLQTLKDRKGNALIAMDQDIDEGVAGKLGPRQCEHMAVLLLEVAGQHYTGPMCGCTAWEQEEPGCVSEDFITIHPVKDTSLYTRLIDAFP